jgi:hypothetical protein
VHNTWGKTKSKSEQEFVDTEIVVDEASDKLAGVEIEEGKFVSFRYSVGKTDVLLNPKVSTNVFIILQLLVDNH